MGRHHILLRLLHRDLRQCVGRRNAALWNAPRLTIPWTKRPAKSMANGRGGAPTPPTTNLKWLRTERNHLPVLAFKATPSSSGSGTILPAPRPTENQQAWPQSLTTQSPSTLATAHLPAISAVAVVPATTVLEFANVSRVSQVPPVRRLLISSKYVCIPSNS